MESEGEQELVEHKVEVDEYVSATLKIPKVLTAIELKALMVKANKLFNLAEVPLVPGRKVRSYRGSMTEVEGEKLIAKYSKASDVEKVKMAEKLGISEKALYQKVWSLKRRMQ